MIINPQNINRESTELCAIMSKHGSDKALGWDN
jgi:hypothetical protein